MNREWSEMVVSKIGLACYVMSRTEKIVHKDRPFHGLVLNDADLVEEYSFSDGTVLHTEGGSLYYLPKHASYTVKRIAGDGGCYAINFDAELADQPFCLKPRNADGLRRYFKSAADEWRVHGACRIPAAMEAVYGIVYAMKRELEREYMPAERYGLIAPAVELLSSQFCDPQMTVASLARACNMSEVYFRRIFVNRFGISPKEYLIRRRMEYAAQLIASGEFAIAEIALMCGYGEPCHFSREFRRHVGVSPRTYRG